MISRSRLMMEEAQILRSPSFPDRWAMLRAAVEVASSGGHVVEFGVGAGESINFIAELMPDRTIHGFDSFEGLPEAWGPHEKGAFAADYVTVRKNVRLHVGLFEDTLWRSGLFPCSPALAHIDCDLYSSARTVLGELDLCVGAVVVFDECHSYEPARQGELMAWLEHVESDGVTYEWRGRQEGGSAAWLVVT